MLVILQYRNIHKINILQYKNYGLPTVLFDQGRGIGKTHVPKMPNPVGLADTPPRGKPLTDVLWISMKSSHTVKYGCFRQDLGCARKKIEVCHVQKCVKCT